MNTQPQIEAEPQQLPLPEARPAADLTSVSQEVPIVLEHALIRNLAMLQQHNLASAEDCSQVAASVRRSWESGKGADPIAGLARLRAGNGNMLDASVEMISSKMAKSLPFAPTRVPFAARLIAPTSFYEKYPQITLLCKLMLVPIVYSEDLDVIGIGSINPFFADTLAAALADEIRQVSPVQPIVSIVRLDYVGWMKMCEKHFR
ncbi:hypothetical protein NT6N_35400 [Oceaniferula spumae]|uniref:Uncharacterized protein n=1 Tax=Oceaniferula spumae TaxID=2979115 RepID=A0AAT9FR34_9BACT